MNQKGIVLSGLIYALLVFFLLVVGSMLTVLWYRQNIIDNLSEDANTIYDNPNTPPVITLLGNRTIRVNVGASYNDAGATAFDAENGDITWRMETTNNVDTSIPGTYTVTYNVYDVSGILAVTVTRNVIVDYPNEPLLAQGMIPVKWVTDHWETTTEDDVDWYQYGTTPSTRKWANVIQVNEGVRASYETAGKTVDVANDVIAMWVWIPRYIYNISNGWHQQMTSTTGGTIQVQFSMGTDDTRDGTVSLVNTGNATDSNGTWTSHPAFKFGNDQLKGIWVAKFEASGTTSAIDVKPNVSPILSTKVGDMFTATRNMETNNRYGWNSTGTNLDTHLMKNIEWGAVAYLTQSSYGTNKEIGVNKYYNNGYRTGCGAAPGSSQSTTCNTYDTAGVVASTTGNIYGVYDMSGGTYEYVSAYVGNSYADDYGGSITSLTGDDVKYKDVYNIGATDTGSNNYTASINHKGDAVYETSGVNGDPNWYNDQAYMPETYGPWFWRGGGDDGFNLGVFDFGGNTGEAIGGVGFRPVVLVGTGL